MKNRFIPLLILTLLTLGCSKDKHKCITNELHLEIYNVSVRPGALVKVKILSGNGDYQAVSDNDNLATAEANGSEIIIKGVDYAGGNTIVRVTDGKNLTAAIDVSVPTTPRYLYVPGSHQGWNPETAKYLSSNNSDGIYRGHIYLDGEFKFSTERNWDGDDYGDNGKGELTLTGGSIDAPPGFYFIEVDLNDMTYSLTEAAWSIIGDATPGGWDIDTPMAYSRQTDRWSVTTDLTAGEYKFRANNGWDLNMGRTAANLITNDPQNLSIDQPGTYYVSMYLENDETSYYTVAYPLVLSMYEIIAIPGDLLGITILSGNGGYTVSSSDESLFESITDPTDEVYFGWLVPSSETRIPVKLTFSDSSGQSAVFTIEFI